MDTTNSISLSDLLVPNPTFDCISPIDFRYLDPDIGRVLSERAFIHYKLQVELALVTVLCKRGLCPPEVLSEVSQAAADVTVEEVYAEEARVGHDIRALVNCLQRRSNEAARPFIHFSATSYDIVDTANVLRTQKAVQLLLREMRALLSTLITLAEREAETLQIGRTHGQHGVPITFGFAIAGYVDRLGSSIEHLTVLAKQLVGKFSGAVGAFNASSLFFPDPREFEAQVLAELGVFAANHSTQIVPPEPLIRLLAEIAIAAGIVGNLARDMRNLQRTEIAEVCESFGANQVGSSTMAHKRNPISWENIESVWHVIQTRMPLVMLSSVSEHQRDLTGSASSRTFPEIIAYAIYMMKRAKGVVAKLQVDHGSMKRNLAMTQGAIFAEPLYILLAANGHPDAHELSRQLSMAAREQGRPLLDVALENATFSEYYNTKFTEAQRTILTNPHLYVGQAKERTLAIAADWKERLGL